MRWDSCSAIERKRQVRYQPAASSACWSALGVRLGALLRRALWGGLTSRTLDPFPRAKKFHQNSCHQPQTSSPNLRLAGAHPYNNHCRSQFWLLERNDGTKESKEDRRQHQLAPGAWYVSKTMNCKFAVCMMNPQFVADSCCLHSDEVW
jgi:hypothetical protein